MSCFSPKASNDISCDETISIYVAFVLIDNTLPGSVFLPLGKRLGSRATSGGSEFIIGKVNNLLIVGWGQDNPPLLPVFFGLFDTFFTGRDKVPPDEAFA